jgi:hypothetical protein
MCTPRGTSRLVIVHGAMGSKVTAWRAAREAMEPADWVPPGRATRDGKADISYRMGGGNYQQLRFIRPTGRSYAKPLSAGLHMAGRPAYRYSNSILRSVDVRFVECSKDQTHLRTH